MAASKIAWKREPEEDVAIVDVWDIARVWDGGGAARVKRRIADGRKE